MRSTLEAVPGKLLFEHGVERLTLLSRCVPRGLYADSNLRDHIQVLPVDESQMLYDYCTLPERDAHLLEVNTFGGGQVYVDGERVKLETVGMLPRNLLFYMLDRRINKRNDIFQSFWPGIDDDKATNVFHVTKRIVHDLVGVELTEYSSGYYRIAHNVDVRYDVDMFRELVQAAQMPAAESVQDTLETALNLYRSRFLSSLDGVTWVQERRAELEELRVEVCVDLAQRYQQAGKTEAALGLYLRAYADNIAREDIVAHIMRIYLQTGRSCDALVIYERILLHLLQKLNVLPAKALRDLAKEAQAACADGDS
jgi:DNA-binding SARP family transcriptional activator